jgi:hypothetical protein
MVGGTVLDVTRMVGLSKTILTVFYHNHAAYNFYTHKMEYTIDEISPSNCGETTDYEILSKRVK